MKGLDHVLRSTKDSEPPEATPPAGAVVPETVPEPEKSPIRIRTTKDLERIISPEQLKLIAASSGGFTVHVDPTLEPYSLGYTELNTLKIFLNPWHLQVLPEQQISGFLKHEVGHHTDEAKALQDKMRNHLIGGVVVPAAYAKNPELKREFYGAVYKHLQNALADVWLEAFLGRKPFYSNRDDINSLYESSVPTFKHLSFPEQMGQYIVGEARHPSGKPLEELFDPEVIESMKRVEKSGAMNTLMRTQQFENPFATPFDKEQAIARKFDAYQQVFLPEWLKLVDAQVKKEAEEEQKKPEWLKQFENELAEWMKDEMKRQAEEDRRRAKEAKAKGEEPKQGPQESPEDIKKRGANKLIEKLKDALRKKLLEELGKEGEKRGSLAPSKEDGEKEKRFRDAVKGILDADAGKGKPGKPQEGGKPGKPESEGPKGLEALSDAMQRAQEARDAEAAQGLAGAYGVGAEDIRVWQEVREQYRDTIERTAAQLAEIFLDDRRQRIEYLQREGIIVPGLEFETVAAVASGEQDPETRMKNVSNPEFLETELEFVVDKSGSMSGEKMKKTIELLVVLVEAMQRVKETLAGENLLSENEDPLRIGLTSFDTESHRITPLEDTVDDRKEVKIVSALSNPSGGTSETGTITTTYEELRLHSPYVLKIIVLETDGAGDGEAVAPIMMKIGEDDQVVFLAIGLGETDEDANAIVSTYLDPVKQRDKNVFAMAKTDVSTLIPDVLDFLKREVERKRNQLH